MSSLDAEQDRTPFPFNYSVDNEMLTIVIAREMYVIPFHKARAAFDLVRQCMIDMNAFGAAPLHRDAPASTNTPATSLQLLKRYHHLIVNHPSRDVPKEPFHHMQFEKRTQLLDQIFSKVIGTIYVRGVGRPPRKYIFNDDLELMLLEHVLQHKAHLRPRSELSTSFANIRKSILLKYQFASDHTVPAPSTMMEGAPTVSQLMVRYQYLISSHVNSVIKQEADQQRDPEATRKLRHLLDIIVRAIVTQALSGRDLLRKSRRSSFELLENDGEHPVPRTKRRKSYPGVETSFTEPVILGNGSRTPNFPQSRPTAATGVKDVKGNGHVTVRRATEPRTLPHVEPENENVWRRRMEERRLAIEEDQQKKNWRLVALQEQRMKIEQQRVNLQEKTFEMMQEECKVLIQTLSGLATVFSNVAQKLGIVDPKANSGDEDFEGKTMPLRIVDPKANSGGKDIEGKAMSLSIDPVPSDTAVVAMESVANNETLMDIEPTMKETPNAADEPAPDEMPPVENKQNGNCRAPMERRATVENESKVKNEPPTQDGSSREDPREQKQAKGVEPGGAEREVEKVAPLKQSAVVNEGHVTKSSGVGAASGPTKNSDREKASANASTSK